MTDVASLILLRAPPGTEALPPMLAKYKVAWRYVDARLWSDDNTPLSHTEIRRTVNDSLKKVLDHCDGGNPIPWRDLRDIGDQLYSDIVPVDIQRILAEVGQAEKPVLLIHSERRWDWMPWEIMYDKHELKEFLGLRFQIARLPILSRLTSPIRTIVPDLGNGQVHHVQTIRNLLGRDVLDDQNQNDPLLPAWKRTFVGLGAPAGINVVSLPDVPLPGAVWPIKQDAEDVNAHIVHFTCHGIEDSGGERVWSLSLTEVDSLKHHLGKGWVRQLDLTQAKPLVFGNACGSLNGGSSAQLIATFGHLFVEAGAPNFVGSLGPLFIDVALTFARTFYEHLLEQSKPIGEALLATKHDVHGQRANKNPSYLFYSLYGLPTTCYRWRQ